MLPFLLNKEVKQMFETREELDLFLCKKYEERKDKIKMQKVLRTIKPLSKEPNGKEIELSKIEDVIIFMSKKWEIMIQWISPSFYQYDRYYSAGIKETIKHEWLGNVYAENIYELYIKLAIKIYYEIKINKIRKRG